MLENVGKKAPGINIDGQKKWNPSTKLGNPDGPIEPLPSMNNYRERMNAPRKKHDELSAKIKAKKKEALGLLGSYQSQEPPVDQFEVTDEGYIFKEKNIYSSLSPMGNEEEYKTKYIIDEEDDIGEGECGVVFDGRRLADNK